jgi:serine/threonine protein kinase
MPAAPSGPSAKPPGHSGRVIARCRIADKLGRGATGHVFRAHYEPLAKDVAVKILAKDASSEEMRTRFLSEARAVAKLNHENIVKVLDVVEDQGYLCILMELVAGPTLQDRIDDEGPIPPRHAFQIGAQIARALEAAHEEKLVHRDVKPANVMLVGARGEETVKVVDFGLAAQGEMNRVGTPMFMSPEAAQGKRIDEKSDVYALGICLYYMLTGVLPFTGATVKEILAAQVNLEAPPPSKYKPQLKPYDDLLKKLLVKSKGYRPTAGEAADLLEDIADDLEEREVGVRRERKQRKLARKKKTGTPPAVWIGLAAAGIALVAFFALSGGGAKPPKTPEVAKAPTSVTPAPTSVHPSQKAFEDAAAWIAAHPGDLKEAVRRWQSVETQFAGTPSGTQASLKRAEAEAALKAAEDAAPKAPRVLAPPPPQRGNDVDAQVARLNAQLKAWNFAEAAGIYSEIEEPPASANISEWDRSERRVVWMGKKFVTIMDAGFKAAKRPVKAKDLVPDIKGDDKLVGANSKGFVGEDKSGTRTTIDWSRVDAERFFSRENGIVDNVLVTEDYDAVLVLAALAYELKLPEKTQKRYRGNAEGLAGSDEGKLEQIRLFFGD